MRCCFSSSADLLQIHYFFTWVPVIGTVVALVDLCAKDVLRNPSIYDRKVFSAYCEHIYLKPAWQLLVLLVPILGAIAIAIYQAVQEEMTTVETQARRGDIQAMITWAGRCEAGATKGRHTAVYWYTKVILTIRATRAQGKKAYDLAIQAAYAHNQLVKIFRGGLFYNEKLAGVHWQSVYKIYRECATESSFSVEQRAEAWGYLARACIGLTAAELPQRIPLAISAYEQAVELLIEKAKEVCSQSCTKGIIGNKFIEIGNLYEECYRISVDQFTKQEYKEKTLKFYQIAQENHPESLIAGALVCKMEELSPKRVVDLCRPIRRFPAVTRPSSH
jgi:hypothetical protein